MQIPLDEVYKMWWLLLKLQEEVSFPIMDCLKISSLRIVLIFLLIFSTSCGEKIDHFEITSNLILDFKEEYEDNKTSAPVLKLLIETEDNYECSNYILETRSLAFNKYLRIDVISSTIGNRCLTAFGPATKSLECDEDVQNLILKKNDALDEFMLEITDERVSIHPLSSGFAAFNYNEYYRYPENSFAFLCGTLPEDSVFCKQFEAVLFENIRLEKFTFPSDGKPPYPERSAGHWYDAPASYFKYYNPNDLATAGSLLKSFYNSELIGKSGIGLTIIGWNNTQFRNEKQLN